MRHPDVWPLLVDHFPEMWVSPTAADGGFATVTQPPVSKRSRTRSIMAHVLLLACGTPSPFQSTAQAPERSALTVRPSR
jgi:hypothetical protein